MTQILIVRNRQSRTAINSRLLREITKLLLGDVLRVEAYEIGIHIVGSRRMAKLNAGFLGHPGSTDVITFDYSRENPGGHLHGEIFICVDDARIQARKFQTSWQEEVARYVAHGLLHLLGHDDHKPSDRKTMKLAENRAVQRIKSRFRLSRLAGKPRLVA